MDLLINFIISVTKYLSKAVKRRKVSSGSQFEGTVHYGRQSRQQGCEVAGRIASTTRKHQEVDAGAQAAFCFSFSLGPQPLG